MPRHFVSTAGGHDADGSLRQVPQQSGIRFLHVKYDSEIVRSIDVIDKVICRRPSAANLPAEQRIEGPFHVARGERSAVVKSYSVTQVKNVSERIGNLPALGQARRDIQIRAACEEIVENQAVDALRLRIDSHARVEIRRARFDHHHQSVGIRLRGAGGQEKRQRKRD